jgi:hypothetical protein
MVKLTLYLGRIPGAELMDKTAVRVYDTLTFLVYTI